MRRQKAPKREKAPQRGRWLWILLAGLIGFIIGDRHAAGFRPADLSAYQDVALRFADPVTEAAPNASAASEPIETNAAASPMVLGDTQLALLNPRPMVPPAAVHTGPAADETTASLPSASKPAPRAPTAAPPRSELTKPAAAQEAFRDEASRHANRPGFLLNDAQIASIKTRLHLTAGQQQMWPAVEVALRAMAYGKEHAQRQHGASGSSAVAALDPDSAAVQGLKSAAGPLIMSFSAEQKNEVRSLAHVMGLDKLASEF